METTVQFIVLLENIPVFKHACSVFGLILQQSVEN